MAPIAMCGRYTLTAQLSFLADLFGFDAQGVSYAPSYNIPPTQEVLVVTAEGGRRQAQTMRWGLIPSWAKGLSMGNRAINARAETLDERPAFKEALTSRRCLVPADGFYEWRRQAGRSLPYRAVLRSGGPFAFAGLWDQWLSPDGELVRSCAIVTTSANEVMAPIHDRMPVILPRKYWEVWLDHRVQSVPFLKSLLKPYLSEEMCAYPVPPLVNSPLNNSPEVIEHAPIPPMGKQEVR